MSHSVVGYEAPKLPTSTPSSKAPSGATAVSDASASMSIFSLTTLTVGIGAFCLEVNEDVVTAFNQAFYTELSILHVDQGGSLNFSPPPVALDLLSQERDLIWRPVAGLMEYHCFLLFLKTQSGFQSAMFPPNLHHLSQGTVLNEMEFAKNPKSSE